MKIFIVNGRGGCGKTSFEKMIVEIENDDVEGLTIQTTEINLTNGTVDY